VQIDAIVFKQREYKGISIKMVAFGFW